MHTFGRLFSSFVLSAEGFKKYIHSDMSVPIISGWDAVDFTVSTVSPQPSLAIADVISRLNLPGAPRP
jgi:hypothetical protein